MTVIGKNLTQPVTGTQLPEVSPLPKPAEGTMGASFTGRLASAIEDVAAAQNSAAAISRAYEMGQEQDLAKVMVSQQISSLGFQLTMNVRNKVLSAYKDIMNMPV